MKNVVFILTFFTSFFAATAQQLTESELSSDMILRLYDPVQLADGSFFFSGSARPLVGFDSSMAIIAKVDTALQLVWSKRFKGLSQDDFVTLTPLADGNLLAGGTLRGNGINLSGGSVFKIDTAGNILWHKVYTDSYDDRVIAAFEQADTSLVLIIRKGVFNTPSKVVHIASDGTLLNSFACSTNGQGLVVDVAGTNGEGIYYLVGDQVNTATGHSQLVLLAVDDNALQWSRTYDMGRSVFCSEIELDSSGDLLLVGTIIDTMSFFSSFNSWLMKLSDQGDVAWTREFYQTVSNNEFINDVIPTAEGGMLATGQIFTNTGSVGLYLKVDSLGNPQETWGYNQYLNQGFTSVDQLPDGRLLFNGTSTNGIFLMVTSDNGESSCSDEPLMLQHNPISVSVATPTFSSDTPSLTPNSPTITTSSPEITSTEICTRTVGLAPLVDPLSAHIFPNPALNVLYVALPAEATGEARISLLDLWGRICTHLRATPGETVQIEMQAYPPGMYWVQIETDQGLLSKKVLHQ